VSSPHNPPIPGPSSAVFDADNQPSEALIMSKSSPQKSRKNDNEKNQGGASAQPGTRTSVAPGVAPNPTNSSHAIVSPQMQCSTANHSVESDNSDNNNPCPASTSKPTPIQEGDSVLNLNGPPPHPVDSPNHSPKKKRKKRKKKKRVVETAG